MTIPQSRYIKIKNILTENRSVARRNLSGLVFTTNPIAPYGYVIEMGSAADVRAYFGRKSNEYGFALAYFSTVGYGGKFPDRISFTRYSKGDTDPIRPTLMSQICSIDMDDFRNPIGGNAKIVLRTTETEDDCTVSLPLRTSGEVIGLHDCLCLSGVCSVYNAKVSSDTTLPQWVRSSRLAFVNGRFLMTFEHSYMDGDTEVVGRVPGELLPCEETPLASAFGFTEEFRVVVSDAGGDSGGLVGAISRVARDYDDFGSFCFLDGADDVVGWTGVDAERFWISRLSEIEKVDKWLASENYRFMFVAGFSANHSWLLSSTGLGYSTHIVLFNPSQYSFEECEAMGIFSTIDYSSQKEAEYSWMFRSNPLLIPLDADLETSESYVKRNINFYGLTQEVGAERAFYQPGKNADGSDTSVVCSEIWLKDAIQTAIINRFLSEEKVAFGDISDLLIGDDISAVLREALNNGMIVEPDELTNTQKLYINRTFGDNAFASEEVAKDGYCFSLSHPRVGELHYLLIYHKNGNFRRIEGTHIA